MSKLGKKEHVDVNKHEEIDLGYKKIVFQQKCWRRWFSVIYHIYHHLSPLNLGLDDVLCNLLNVRYLAEVF